MQFLLGATVFAAGVVVGMAVTHTDLKKFVELGGDISDFSKK